MQDLVRKLLAELGEDPSREGLVNTPKRVEKALRFLTSGYAADIDEVLNNALFTVDYSEMVIVKDVDFYSLCEHHLLPFFGKCHVAYIPTTKVIGLSKIPRLVDVFSRRLQVQERLTNEIANTIREKIAPLGVAVVMEATHLCMSMRGVEKQNSFAVTSAMLGAFRDNARTRMEFLELITLRKAVGTMRDQSALACVGDDLTAAIFLTTFAVLAAGRAPLVRIDRTGAAIVGAVLMVVTGAISFPDAVRAVDVPTLVLLFGMMIIVAHLRLAGGIALVARAIGGGVQSRLRLLFALVFAAGLLSALFVNDTICLVFTPVVLDLAAARRERPLPYLLALATASNIGSVATITGNPQNMLIGSVSGITFARFAAALTPVAIVGLAIDGAIIWALFRRELASSSTAIPELPRVRTHRPLLIKTLVVIAGVLTAFLAGFDSALVAVSGAAALLITRRVRPRKIYAAIDWDLLVLFAGLFVVVGAGERAGFDRRLLEWLRPLGVQTVAGLSATAAVLSNAVSNVPAVMLFTRIVPRLPSPERGWLALAMSSTLAGNLTVLGSIANLIVIEGARRRGVTVSFTEYSRVGVPLTAITILFGILWLSWRV